MKVPAFLGATLAATLSFAHVASADDYVSRIACLPTANVSAEPYWVDCESQPNANCTCGEGFTAFNPADVGDDASGAGGRPQPVSASPG